MFFCGLVLGSVRSTHCFFCAGSAQPQPLLCKMLDSIGNSSLVMAGEQQDPSVHVPGAISCRVVLYLFWCSSVTAVTDTSCSLPLAYPDSTSAGLPLFLPSCVTLFVCVCSNFVLVAPGAISCSVVLYLF